MEYGIYSKINLMKWLKFLSEELYIDGLFVWKNIWVYLHGTHESAIFMYYLKKLGANIYYSSCNPLSLRSEVLEFLKEIWVKVYSKEWENEIDIQNNIKNIFWNEIDLIVDDGCALISYYVLNNIDQNIKWATEQTSWWINKFLALLNDKNIDFPVIWINEHKSKHLFDNNKWVSSSLIGGILNELHITFAWKNILLLWYWNVWKWIARDLRFLWSRVQIAEVSSFAALEAYYDWFYVNKKELLLHDADIIITATWSRDVINLNDVWILKDWAYLINVWHSNVEIEVEEILSRTKNIEIVSKNISKLDIFWKNIYLFNDWRVANLISWKWNPPELMELTFMNQLYWIYYILKNWKNLSKTNINILSKHFDEKIAELKLRSIWCIIDERSEKQLKYLKEWNTQI